jgi:hypothetical protein
VGVTRDGEEPHVVADGWRALLSTRAGMRAARHYSLPGVVDKVEEIGSKRTNRRETLDLDLSVR